jgi:hypothetical protein
VLDTNSSYKDLGVCSVKKGRVTPFRPISRKLIKIKLLA